MRSQDEIQRAHDLLLGIILREIPRPKSALLGVELSRLASVLCWVLGHEDNTAFCELLENLERELEAMGFVLEKRSN